MKEITITDLKKLIEINDVADIKSFEVRDEYTDDHLPCADVTINGVDCEFMWRDNVGFIHYWGESKKAFNALKEAIMGYVGMHIEGLYEDGGCTSEEFKEVLSKCE